MVDLAKIRAFVDTRKSGGLGDKDVKDLVKLVADGNAKLTASQTAQLQKVAGELPSLFTKPGSAALEKLTGIKVGNGNGAAVDVDAVRATRGGNVHVPKSWHEISTRSVQSAVKRLIDDGDSVTLRLKSGREIGVDASDQIVEFVKKGYLKLYKNEKDNSDVDDEGRKIWYSASYVVPTKQFAELDAQMEKFAKRADGITKGITTELEKLHSTMHASRVNGLGGPPDLKKIKAEVAAELPKAKAAIIGYEEAKKSWEYDTQRLDYPNGEVFLMDWANNALHSVGPHVDQISLRDLNFTKDLIRANEMLLSRPEVEAVDPGFGIRINFNTDVLVKNGGNVADWKAEVTKQLKDALITDEINFDKNNNSDGVLTAAQVLLQNAVGKANVRDGYQYGDKDFPDHVRGTEVTLYVKKDKLAEARTHIDDLKKLFAPHGYDMKHFSVRIEEDT